MKWPAAKLESLAARVPYAFVGGPFGSNLTSRDYVSEGVPVIRGSNLNNGRFIDTSDFVYVSEMKVREDLSGNLAAPGDLVFTQRGTLGQVAIVPVTDTLDQYVISQSQMKLTVDPERVDYRFLYYYFTTAEAIGRIRSYVSSSGVPHINLTVLRNFEVPVPPRSVQTQIADALWTYDDLIENNIRRIKLLENAAQLLYEEWFVRLRFPGHEHVRIRDGVPVGWDRKAITDVCETIGGGTPSTTRSEYWDGDITWIVPSDITKNGCLVLLDSERKITEAGLRNSSARMVPPDTILMTSRASVGYFAMIDREVCTNQGFINIIPHSERLRMYLLFNLLARVDEIRANAKGSTYPEISKGRFRDMPVIVPAESLVVEFGAAAGAIIRQIRCLKRQLVKLREARDLLLPRLMSGEVSV